MLLKHVLFRNPRLKGVEYGVLRSFEDEIITQTGAATFEVPYYGMHPITKRIGHGMRWQPIRSWMPKKTLPVDADVIWYILMGPENYELDLFESWNTKAKYRIVYLYDTLEPQFPLIEKLFSDSKFNICITSFSDAVTTLQNITGQKWHDIEQAVPASFANLIPPEQRVIDFSTYGRRLDSFHNALKEFCKSNKLYYDYSTHRGTTLTATEDELYAQYLWHLSHSIFTVSWPVELTNPARAGRLQPVTCRWFEAASTGTIILGKKPDNHSFDTLLAPDLVQEIDPNADKKEIWLRLEQLYENRFPLLQKAAQIQKDNVHRWTWSNKVSRILQIMEATSQ